MWCEPSIVHWKLHSICCRFMVLLQRRVLSSRCTASLDVQMATICCISWRSELALWNSVCWHWMNGLSKCECCVCGWCCVWGGVFFFSLSVFKHSPGLYRIIDFLLVASLTFSVSSLWTMGLASFFLPELSQDVICLSSFYSSNQCSWVI